MKFFIRFSYIAFFVFMSQTTFSAGPDISLTQKYPWLTDTSRFVQELDLSKGNPGITSLGGYGLGSGYVFALQGVAFPQNALTNIVGPNYEKHEGELFPPVWHGLSYKKDGTFNVVKITSSKLSRIRKTSIIVSEEISKNFSLTTISFAPFKEKRFFRIIVVKNTSDKAIGNFYLSLHNKTLTVNGEVLDGKKLVSHAGDRTMISSIFANDIDEKNFESSPGVINMKLPKIEAGEEFIVFEEINFTNDTMTQPASETVFSKLEANYSEWNEWMNGAISAKSSDGYLGDLFDNTLALLKVQMTADNGALAVMARYSGMWCRDTFGPVRYLRHSGKFDEIKKITSFYDLATRMIGFRNRYPVDLDLSKAPAETDWNSMSPQQGDDPNLLMLQYYYYYMATGDSDFIKEHYGFLKRNFTGQEHKDCRLPFHSDETYQVFVMMAETAKMHDFYSADTGFEYVVASAAMAEMATAIGEDDDSKMYAEASQKCRQKTEEYYWDEENGYYSPFAWKNNLKNVDYPFANINLRPLWIDYGAPTDSKQRRNLFFTGKSLSKKNGIMKSAPKVGYYTGMTPGLLLYNFKATGLLKRADITFEGMMNDVISPTGEFAEAFDTKDRWMNYAVEPNIYRPWETSINTEAVLYYVTGIKYKHETDSVIIQPHLPPGVTWFSIDNLHAGKHILSLDMQEEENSNLNVLVKNTGEEPFKITIITETPDTSTDEKQAKVPGSAETSSKFQKLLKELSPGESVSVTGKRFSQ